MTVAIVGVGETEPSRRDPRTVPELAADEDGRIGLLHRLGFKRGIQDLEMFS